MNELDNISKKPSLPYKGMKEEDFGKTFTNAISIGQMDWQSNIRSGSNSMVTAAQEHGNDKAIARQ